MQSCADRMKPASLAIAALAIAGIFLLDLATPPGTIVWAAYLLPLLLMLWGAGRRAYLLSLIVCTGLLVAASLIADERSLPLSILNRAIGSGVIWLATLFILPWEKAQGDLHESQRAMAVLLANLPGMVYRCSNEPGWPLTFASEGALALTRYSPAQLKAGHPPYGTLIHPEDRRAVWDAVQAALRARIPFQVTYRIRTATGEERQLWEQGRGVFSRDGEPLLLEGFITDVTERMRDQARLQEAFQRLTFHVENSPLAVMEWGPDFRLQRWSRQAEVIFGWGAEEVLGKHPAEWPFVYGEDREAVDEVMARLGDGRDRRNMSRNRNYTKDGTVVHCEWYNSVLLDSQGRVVSILSLVLDVSEQKRLEAQFLQAQKMEAIGQLAGGIAHDFNNLLTGINGYGELVLSDLGPEHRLRPAVEQILYAGVRAASLTRQLLAFSRKQVLAPKVLDLNEVVENAERFLQRLIGEDIVLVTHLDPSLGCVKADPGQVDQVIVNLLVNARDAMPRGGRVTIETKHVDLDETDARTRPAVSPGPYVLLAISDTGSGIPPHLQSRIFEPFFTTKEPGKGTGLGLATVYGIVEQSNGAISVDSEPGNGATFKVYLPRVKASPDRDASVTKDARLLQGSETILVVEDEALVLDLARAVLERYGYTVLATREAADAVRLSERRDPIDLLLTDIVMPRMNGRQVADWVKVRHPRIQVLYMSGYTDRAVFEHAVPDPDTNYIQKPFTPTILARKVRAVLGPPVETGNGPCADQPTGTRRREES